MQTLRTVQKMKRLEIVCDLKKKSVFSQEILDKECLPAGSREENNALESHSHNTLGEIEQNFQ